MTTINTINTIEDLARILQEQPTWAEALRALLLTRELLELPERFDRSVQAQQETNRQFRQRFDNIEGRLGNLEGAQYERTVRTKALARTQIALGFEGARVALNQEGLVDPQLNSSVARAVRDGHVTQDGYTDLYETDIIISARDNRHAVVEVSITADANDIDRARSRAGILTAVTGGTVTPMVITARLDPVQSEQAEVEGVEVFVIAYP